MNASLSDDFLRFSTGMSAVGSKAPASYVAAIEKTTEALQRHHLFLAPGESIWDIRDAARLEEHCKQISLARVGSAHSVWVTLGFPLLLACVLSWSTLLRLQVALQENCLKQALG